MASVDKWVRRQSRLEKDVFNGATRARLPYSSIDGGSLEIKDDFGQTQGIVGEQWDGTNTIASVGGGSPPPPTIPFVVEVVGGLTIYWDGTYVDDSVARMDFRRVTFHVVTDIDTLDPLDPAQFAGEITTAVGGSVSITLPPVEHFVVGVTWTDSGKFSVESDVAFGTPFKAVDPEMWAGHDQALADLAVELEGTTDTVGSISELVALINKTSAAKHAIY